MFKCEDEEITWNSFKNKTHLTSFSFFVFFPNTQMASASVDNKWQKDAADQNFDYMFKLLIIGNSSVGKTSFLFRYADDSFTSAFVSTVGIDFKVKTVFRQDKRVKLQIWVRFMAFILCIFCLFCMIRKEMLTKLYNIFVL